WARRRRFYQAWAIILVATGIGFLGGFLFSTVLLLVGFGIAFGRRENRGKNVIVAVVLAGGVYFVFGRIMAVPLLDGVLW
ncbi:MAG: tripartite tricarboxylate transporter TctB family protein, partial [Burkholderiales bacterium]